MTENPSHPSERLVAHLRTWLGAWPPPSPGVTVVGSRQREVPAWDGRIVRFIGLRSPQGTIVSVPPHAVEPVVALGDDLESRADVGDAVGLVGGRVGAGFFRWCEQPADLPDAGEWVSRDDPRVPDWLKPFNGDVLVAWDDDGSYLAGVGRKQHDRFGHELAITTEERGRNRGLARALVAQAARQVLADGAVATYLHQPSNVASAHVAEASGFPDRGWRILSLFGAHRRRPDQTA